MGIGIATWHMSHNSSFIFSDDSNELGFTAFLLTALSVFLILVTVPFSLCLVIKVSINTYVCSLYFAMRFFTFIRLKRYFDNVMVFKKTLHSQCVFKKSLKEYCSLFQKIILKTLMKKILIFMVYLLA